MKKITFNKFAVLSCLSLLQLTVKLALLLLVVVVVFFRNYKDTKALPTQSVLFFSMSKKNSLFLVQQSQTGYRKTSKMQIFAHKAGDTDKAAFGLLFYISDHSKHLFYSFYVQIKQHIKQYTNVIINSQPTFALFSNQIS